MKSSSFSSSTSSGRRRPTRFSPLEICASNSSRLYAQEERLRKLTSSSSQNSNNELFPLPSPALPPLPPHPSTKPTPPSPPPKPTSSLVEIYGTLRACLLERDSSGSGTGRKSFGSRTSTLFLLVLSTPAPSETTLLLQLYSSANPSLISQLSTVESLLHLRSALQPPTLEDSPSSRRTATLKVWEEELLRLFGCFRLEVR